MGRQTLNYRQAALIFGLATAYFFLLLFSLFPFLKSHFTVNPALYWFITGYFLFVPLFVYPLIKVRREGGKSFSDMLRALNVRHLTTRDWKYAVGGLVLTFAGTGMIYGILLLANKYFGVTMISMTPWFMQIHPFEGSEKLLLLVWLPMFFFNIVGEELLWRGYIQSRLQGAHSLLLCSLLWLMFHLPFGADLVIMLLPIFIIVPFAFRQTQNTQVGIFIHGIYNGPIFVALALGLME